MPKVVHKEEYVLYRALRADGSMWVETKSVNEAVKIALEWTEEHPEELLDWKQIRQTIAYFEPREYSLNWGKSSIP